MVPISVIASQPRSYNADTAPARPWHTEANELTHETQPFLGLPLPDRPRSSSMTITFVKA